MGILFVLIFVVLSGVYTVATKLYQKRVKTTAISYTIYLFCTSIASCLLYFLVAGCKAAPNPMMLRYSMIAALIVFLNLILMLLCMEYTNLAVMTVAQNAGYLVLPTLYGVLFLQERLSWFAILGLVFVVSALLVSFVGDYRKNKETAKSSLRGYLACIALFFSSGAFNIIHKAFTLSGAGDTVIYLTWQNIFMFPFVFLLFLFVRLRAKKPFAALIEGIRFRFYGLPMIGSVFGCLGTIASLRAMELLPIALYSPIYSSLYMVCVTATSRFIFKEKLSGFNYASVALAVAAVILSVL